MTMLVEHRVRVRAVSASGRLGCVGYMVLAWTAECPGVVRLAETGPDAGAVEFPRDVLTRALDGRAAVEGLVEARLRCLRGAPHAMLAITVPGADGLPTELAICDATVRGFVAATTDLVPAGEEWRFVGDTVADLLSEAA